MLGFTLIEVMASLMVFTAITVGVVPLIASSIRASTISRASTVGKNVSGEVIEHIRGLPYYLSVPGKRVDLLDLYFPDARPPGYDGAGTYTTVCPPLPSAPPPAAEACAGFLIPEGASELDSAPGETFRVTITAQFVRPAAGDTYVIELPDPNYIWDYDRTSTTAKLDSPKTQLLRLSVTSQWNIGGRDRRFRLETLIAQRDVARNKIAAEARVDYAIQALTSFDPGISGNIDNAVAQAGIARSTLASRIVSTARQDVTAASISLTREDGVNQGVPIGSPFSPITGATVTAEAPPTSGPSTTGGPSGLLEHPTLVDAFFGAGSILHDVGFMDESFATNVTATAVGDDVDAAGGFRTRSPGSPSDDFWVQNQKETVGTPYLPIDPDLPMMTARRFTASGETLTGSTSAEARDLGVVDRGVETRATVFINEIGVIPARVSASGYQRYAILIRNFQATVVCESTAVEVTASTSATWSAELLYWRATSDGHAAHDHGLSSGAYISVPLSGTAGSDPLAAIPRTGTGNPKVVDVTGTNDTYLFDEPTASPPKKGFLTSLASLSNVVANPPTDNGRITAAAIDGAITISTRWMTPGPLSSTDLPLSSLNVSVGKLSCRSEDHR